MGKKDYFAIVSAMSTEDREKLYGTANLDLAAQKAAYRDTHGYADGEEPKKPTIKAPVKKVAASLAKPKPTQNIIPKDEYKRLVETVDNLSDDALMSMGLDKKYIKNGKPNREAIQRSVSDGVVGPLTNAVYAASKSIGKIPSSGGLTQGEVNSFNVLAGLSPTFPVEGNPPAFNPADLDFKNQLAYDYQSNAPAAVPPVSGAANVPPPVVSATPKTNYDGILQDATSGLRALGAAYMAKDGLPSWRPTEDYYRNYGDIKTRSNMGLSAEAKTYAEGMRNRAFSAGAAQIGSLAGGGSSAAALGALSGLNENRFNSVNQGMLMDEAQRTLNQDKFTQAVGQDQNIDRMMYQDRYQQDMYKQQAANAAVAANLQNIQDRRDYDKTYGDGSNYQKMMDAKLQQANLSNLAYKKFLQNQGLGGN